MSPEKRLIIPIDEWHALAVSERETTYADYQPGHHPKDQTVTDFRDPRLTGWVPAEQVHGLVQAMQRERKSRRALEKAQSASKPKLIHEEALADLIVARVIVKLLEIAEQEHGDGASDQNQVDV